MDVIQLLPDSVANQIAAGEVIQRPASVIKELVENAIDAGATEINVLVTEAGKASIQVIDNGKGMSDTDARLSFERHATSKIREAQDLFSLRTMGFRGEALASIAAVAQVTLQTRMADDEIGTRLVIAGSRVTEQEPTSCPVGSNFLVENLFYNIPARRKFLKSNNTELNNIMQAFERIVLVYPEITFNLYSNGMETKMLRKGNLLGRIVDIFGKRINQQLLPLSVETSICKINGYIGKPESAKKKGAQQFFFVNGRYMKHPYFHKAVMTAYERLLPGGEQVSYFIYLTVDPQDIDVNIHPVKTEIKFESERDIWQLLMVTVRDAIGKFSNNGALDFDTEGKPDIPVFNAQNAEYDAPKVEFNPSYNPFEAMTNEAPFVPTVPSIDSSSDSDMPSLKGGGTSSIASSQHNSTHQRPAKGWEELFGAAASGSDSFGGGTDSVHNNEAYIYNKESDAGRKDAEIYNAEPASAMQSHLFKSKLSWDDEPETLAPKSETEDIKESRSTSHFQIQGKYIATQVHSGLLLTDQNRASQRILYERYMRDLANHSSATQRLLFHEMVQFPSSYGASLEIVIGELQTLGFEINDLGAGSYAITGVPASINGLDAVSLVSELVAEAVETDTTIADTLHHTIATSLARRAATPYGELLSNEEMETLIKQLFECETQKYTADGKPVMTLLTLDEIGKRL